jgi:hypothetical protein
MSAPLAHRAILSDPAPEMPALTLWQDSNALAVVNLSAAQCVALASDLLDAARNRMGEHRGRWPHPADQEGAS